MEELFSKVLQVNIRCRESEERKSNIRIKIELHLTTSPVHKRDLLVRLSDDLDPYFLFNLSISEEDFQSLKVQQGLLVDFASFPQKFIDLLNLCYSEQESVNPRFLLHLSCPSPVLEGPANFCVVETNAFKHLNHLSLRLIQGSDKEIKDYLAICLSSLKVEKQNLEAKLKKTEEDLSRQLSYTQQTLSEKTKELDKLRSEWTCQSSSLSTRHSQELQLEREKAVELQSRLQQQNEQLRHDLENSHQKSSQQLHSRLTEQEASCRELTERKYKNESSIRDLKIKLVGAEEESQRLKQQVLSLRRENSTLDTEVHEKERLVNQLQMRVAVLEQESKDKDQLMRRTKEVLEATQQQKESVEENAGSKEVQNRKLETTVNSLSEELIKANGIIKKLQGDLRGLVAKIKVKNTVTVSQEKVLQETSEKLKTTEKELQSVQQQNVTKDEQVSKLKEQLEMSVQKLNESKEVLKTNENVITWLNKQLNEKQLSRNPSVSPDALHKPPLSSTTTATLRAQFYPQSGKAAVSPVVLSADVTPAEQRASQPAFRHTGDGTSLDPKYFERRDDSIPIYGLSSNLLHKVITWLNKQLNEKQLSRNPSVSPDALHKPPLSSTTTATLRAQFYPQSGKAAVSPVVLSADVTPAEQRASQPAFRHTGDGTSLDPKYFERRDDSIPIYGLSSNLLHKDFPQRTKPAAPSAYFSA